MSEKEKIKRSNKKYLKLKHFEKPLFFFKINIW